MKKRSALELVGFNFLRRRNFNCEETRARTAADLGAERWRSDMSVEQTGRLATLVEAF